MTRHIKRYSKEFQEEAIKLALRSKSIDQTARDLGIPISTLHGWVQRLSKKQHPADIQDAKALHEELKQLRKELGVVCDKVRGTTLRDFELFSCSKICFFRKIKNWKKPWKAYLFLSFSQ